MNNLYLQMTLVFAAGCLGGLANGVVVWLSGVLGITKMLGVSIKPAWTPSWIYAKIVWGGLWGFLFLYPLPLDATWCVKGAVYSLGPTLGVLFIVFPFQAKKGFLGLKLGMLTPVFAILVNAVWGIVAAYWIMMISQVSVFS